MVIRKRHVGGLSGNHINASPSNFHQGIAEGAVCLSISYALREVLVMVMRKHQRYFPVVAAPGGPDALLLPAFITVANGAVDQGVVAAGRCCVSLPLLQWSVPLLPAFITVAISVGGPGRCCCWMVVCPSLCSVGAAAPCLHHVANSAVNQGVVAAGWLCACVMVWHAGQCWLHTEQSHC